MKGRSFPVEIKFHQGLANKRVEETVKAAIRMHLHEEQGDILVFLTGSEECEMARKLCIQELTRLKE
jgi:ATP-dependent RNA helicase DHX8/PRP22